MLHESDGISETYRRLFLKYLKKLREKNDKYPSKETKKELLKADEALSFLVFGV